jgi:hypothetical protein
MIYTLTREEAIPLKKLVEGELDKWMAAHGVDVKAVQRQAEIKIRKLEGRNK